jgi:hypothetical protein
MSPKNPSKKTYNWRDFLAEEAKKESTRKSKRLNRVYTKSFSTRQSFGAASEVRVIKPND